MKFGIVDSYENLSGIIQISPQPGGRRLSCPIWRYCPVIRLEKVRKIAKHMIEGIPSGIRTVHFANINRKLYCFGQRFL